MQKVLRQNLLRRNQNIKAARKEDLKKLKNEWNTYDRTKLVADRSIRDRIKAERKTRREDWIQGPLAPNRNSGLRRGIYGTVDPAVVRGPNLPKRERATGKEVMFVPGEYVCVVRGKCKGRIGVIKDLSYDRNEVTIEGMNTADVAVPPWAPGAKSRKELITATDIPIPIEDIRLVLQARNETTGEIEDVVIRGMYGGPPYTEPVHGSSIPEHTRYIIGTNEEIPWPKKENLAEFSAEPADTLRAQVEQITFIPRLIDPVIPDGVEQELRGKHQRGTGRHDIEWMREKLLLDAKETWEKSRRLLTPRQEFAEMQRKQHRPLGPEDVSEETLDIIREMQMENTSTPPAGRSKLLIRATA